MRINWGFVSTLVAVLLGAGTPAGVSAASRGNPTQQVPSTAAWVGGTVVKISDGDTIHVRPTNDAAVLKIRMVGIDTPEVHLPIPGGMVGQGHWGDRASAELESRLPLGSAVRVLTFGKDSHGRTLAQIFLRDQDINLSMVESGWAALYLICSGPTCNERFFEEQNTDEYVAACDQAFAAKKGIFDPRDPLPELPFEFRIRMQKRTPDKWVGDLFTRRLVNPEDYAEIPICHRVFFTTRAQALDLGFHFE